MKHFRFLLPLVTLMLSACDDQLPASIDPGSDAAGKIYYAAITPKLPVVGGSYSIRPNGSGKEEVVPNGALFSPPANGLVAFRRAAGTGGIWVSHVGSDTSIRLDSATDGTTQFPLLSSDSSTVVYGASAVFDVDDLYMVRTDGSGRRKLASNLAHETLPSISPNSEFVAYYGSDSNVYAISLTNPLLSPILVGERARFSGGLYTSLLSWSPNGEKVAYVGENDGGTLDIFTVNFNGGKRENLTGDDFEDIMPSWSPDGRSIVYVTRKFTSGGPWHLRVVDAAGGNGEKRDVVANSPMPFFYPSWSPDSQSLVYTGSVTLGTWLMTGGVLHTVGIDGGNDRVLAQNVHSGYWTR